jgi:hypothetical protein
MGKMFCGMSTGATSGSSCIPFYRKTHVFALLYIEYSYFYVLTELFYISHTTSLHDVLRFADGTLTLILLAL